LRGSIGVSGAISADEARRLAALHRYDVLDTPPDGAFDRVTAIAARLFAAPIAIVSLVDHDRIWFKSHHGLDVRQIDRAPGLCASAILQDGPWVLGDARTDPALWRIPWWPASSACASMPAAP
jgi:eukaryotic-like serine/threonine-protein kinase